MVKIIHSYVSEFDSRLDDATLKSLIYFVCSNFETETDWPVMTKYLKAIAELERFKIIISFIDPKTINGKYLGTLIKIVTFSN